MHRLKLVQIGSSIGAMLPDELVAQLDLREGDELHVAATPKGMTLTVHRPEFEQQLKVGRMLMEKHRAVLRKLAKS